MDVGIDFTDAGMIVGVIVALVEVAKRTFPAVQWERFGPIAAVFFGLLLGVIGHYEGFEWNGSVIHSSLVGMVLGLAASGLWDGVDRLVHRREDGSANG